MMSYGKPLLVSAATSPEPHHGLSHRQNRDLELSFSRLDRNILVQSRLINKKSSNIQSFVSLIKEKFSSIYGEQFATTNRCTLINAEYYDHMTIFVSKTVFVKVLCQC